MIANRPLENDRSAFNQIKAVGGFSCFEYYLVFFEMRRHGGLRQNFHMIHRHPLEERVSRKAFLDSLLLRIHFELLLIASVSFVRAA